MRSSAVIRNASSGLVILAEFRNFLQCLQANVRIVLADRLRPFLSAPYPLLTNECGEMKLNFLAIWQIFTHFQVTQKSYFPFYEVIDDNDDDDDDDDDNNNNNNNNNLSHWNSNDKLKEKFGSCTRKTLDRFTTKDSYTWNITHNTESTAV
jgi:hypothetical protein